MSKKVQCNHCKEKYDKVVFARGRAYCSISCADKSVGRGLRPVPRCVRH